MKLTVVFDYATLEIKVASIEEGKELMKQYTDNGMKVKGFSYDV